MYSDTVISRVRESVDIVDLVSGYVSLRKTGKNYTGLCPFHSEKTPSFSVNPDKQIFHCFGCGVGGDAFKFLEMQKGLNFPEAVRELAARAGIPLPESRPRAENKQAQDERKQLLAALADAADHFKKELTGPAGSAARAYLAKRGVSEAVVAEFGIGWSRPEWEGLFRHLRQKGHQAGIIEKAGLAVKRTEGDGYYDRFRGRIIFPIRDISGSVIAFGGRVMDDSLPKYLNSPETPLYSKSNVLYLLDKAKEPARKQEHFIIVEGYLDAIACHQHGVRNAVATLGTALTDGHLRLMRRFAQQLKLIFDPDPAGVRAALRSFDLLVGSGMNVKVVSLPGGDDPDTYLKKNGFEAFAACLKGSVKLMDFVLAQTLKESASASIDEKVEREAEMLRFITKLPSGIERDHYLKRTAEALNVNEATLRQDMAKLRTPPAGQREGQPVAAQRRQGLRPRAEEILIHLMLRDEKTALNMREEIRPEEFTDPLFRRAAERIYTVLENSGKLDSAALLSGDDEELNNLVSHYTVLDAEYEGTSAELVGRIRMQNHERRIREIERAIKAAEARGDVDEVNRLIEEQNKLGRKSGRWSPGWISS